jgi:hypothetical protein
MKPTLANGDERVARSKDRNHFGIRHPQDLHRMDFLFASSGFSVTSVGTGFGCLSYLLFQGGLS